MMPPEKQRPPWGGGQCGTQETTKSRTRTARVAHLRAPQRNRLGILNYRQQRSVADFSRAIRDALDREARLARHTGVNVAPDVIEDISAWVGRGCLP